MATAVGGEQKITVGFNRRKPSGFSLLECSVSQEPDYEYIHTVNFGYAQKALVTGPTKIKVVLKCSGKRPKDMRNFRLTKLKSGETSLDIQKGGLYLTHLLPAIWGETYEMIFEGAMKPPRRPRGRPKKIKYEEKVVADDSSWDDDYSTPYDEDYNYNYCPNCGEHLK